MTLKIETSSDEHHTALRLIGRVRAEHLEVLSALIGAGSAPIVLDLDGVTLVDVEVVRFLEACEARGVEILHGSPYIREWMARERSNP